MHVLRTNLVDQRGLETRWPWEGENCLSLCLCVSVAKCDQLPRPDQQGAVRIFVHDTPFALGSRASCRYVRGVLKALSIAALLLAHLPVDAFTLKITGLVSNYHTGEPLENALVRVYRDGVKVEAIPSNAFGRYSVRLENDADYVFRFSMPGYATKCFGVDTHGLVWEGEDNVKELFVEMTMIETIPTMDLEFFDMPVGRLRFEPATGLVSWNKDYEAWIRPLVEERMREYDQRWTELATNTAVVAGPEPRR